MDVASVDHPPVLARRPTRSRARPFRLAAAARSCRRAHATAAHGHARQVSPGCPSPRVVSAEAAKTRLLGRAHVRRGAQATSATYRAGPSGAASGRRVEGAGGTGAVRSVGWVEAGSGRRGTTSAPEAGRNALRKRRKRKRARPARPVACLSDAASCTRGADSSAPASAAPADAWADLGRVRQGAQGQGALASASCAPSLETRAIWIFFFDRTRRRSNMQGSQATVYDGRTR